MCLISQKYWRYRKLIFPLHQWIYFEAVYYQAIRDESQNFSFATKAFENIFRLNDEIGLQFLIYLLWAWKNYFKRWSFNSFQNASKNFRDLLLGIDLKALNNSPSSLSQSSFCLLVNQDRSIGFSVLGRFVNNLPIQHVKTFSKKALI